jgi:polysaccharide biosynthesis transport protein
MSRNFELLQNLGQEATIVEADAPVEETQVQPASDPIAQDPQASLDPRQREELVKLTQRIFLRPGAEGPRAVVFTATESGNGCSFICACAGALLASQVGGSVCVLDANLRNPSLHHQFGVENRFGLADALQGPESVLNYARTMSLPNLWLVPAGSYVENSSALLNSGRMRQVIAELRGRVNYLLIDAASMNGSNDAAAVAAAADGAVMVLKANSSRRETVRQVLQELQTSKVQVLGAVLNQRTFPVPDSIYNRL